LNSSFKKMNARARAHILEHTTDLGEKVVRHPVSSYLDAALFDSEMTQVLQRLPLPISASVQTANRGDFLTRTVSGVPLLVVRGESGRARVFINTCRHRGAKLLADATGNIGAGIACPFHGWTYRENGRLSHIPLGDKCFSHAPGGDERLVELNSVESAGMIWAVLDTKAPAISSDFDGSLGADLPFLNVAPRFPLPEYRTLRNFNWKLGVESFLEVYHFPFAHAPYLANIQYPGLSLMDFHGENSRTVVPLRLPNEDEFVLCWSQVMYFVFPATFFLFFSDHVALLNLLPVSLDQTEFRYIPLVPLQSEVENPQMIAKCDFLRVILEQDFTVLEGLQAGLRAGANSAVTFTRLEQGLSRFHDNVNAILNRRGKFLYKEIVSKECP
jgi:phenylpropionate dioxygenase-like ring-hydroxylating dioxygenase large terminal subunit